MVVGRENARFPIKQQRIRGGTNESWKREASTLNPQGSLFLPEHWEGSTEIVAFRVLSQDPAVGLTRLTSCRGMSHSSCYKDVSRERRKVSLYSPGGGKNKASSYMMKCFLGRN